MTPKARVRPVKIHVPSDELHTTIVRGVGFRASCECGERFPARRARADAMADKRAHKCRRAGDVLG